MQTILDTYLGVIWPFEVADSSYILSSPLKFELMSFCSVVNPWYIELLGISSSLNALLKISYKRQ